MIQNSSIAIILVSVAIIGLFIYLILQKNENFSPLDSQLDNTDIFVVCKNCDDQYNASRVAKKFDKLNINYRIYKQINGKIVDMKKLVFQGALKIRDQMITNDDYACFVSNVNIWQIFLQSDRAYCVVLNDNLNIPYDFKNKLVRIMDDLSMTNLDGVVLTSKVSDKLNVTAVTQNIIRDNNLGNSCEGYILTKEGARKLINNTMPIVSTMGNYFNTMNLKGIVKIGKTVTPLIKN